MLTPRWWFEEGRRIDAAPAPRGWLACRPHACSRATARATSTSAALSEAIRTMRPDVIDLYEEPFSLVALQTLLLRNLFAPRAALVFYSAVNVERRWRWPYRAIEQHGAARRRRRPTRPNADVPRILRAQGFAHKPVDVIPLGVDVDRFAVGRGHAAAGHSATTRRLHRSLRAGQRAWTCCSTPPNACACQRRWCIAGDGSLRAAGAAPSPSRTCAVVCGVRAGAFVVEGVGCAGVAVGDDPAAASRAVRARAGRGDGRWRAGHWLDLGRHPRGHRRRRAGRARARPGGAGQRDRRACSPSTPCGSA